MCNRPTKIVTDTPDEFYIALPSNACPDTHPNNHASKYIVSWETPWELHDLPRWKVAMTNISFNHVQTSISREYGIAYSEKRRDKTKFEVDFRTNRVINRTIPVVGQYNDKGVMTPWPAFKIEVDQQYGHVKYSSPVKFIIAFPSDKCMELLGSVINPINVKFNEHDNVWEAFSDKSILSAEQIQKKDYRLTVPDDVDETDLVLPIQYVSQQYTVFQQFVFAEDRYLESIASLIQYVTETLPCIFTTFKYDNELQRVRMQLNYKITFFRFLSGFNLVLGFDQATYDNDKEYIATYKPQTNMGLRCMYIYASVCKPMQVGDVRAPLLGTIWPNADGKESYKLFQCHNVPIIRPMYLGVALSSINSIEINIRSDSGDLIRFPQSSITNIIIHFKKT